MEPKGGGKNPVKIHFFWEASLFCFCACYQGHAFLGLSLCLHSAAAWRHSWGGSHRMDWTGSESDSKTSSFLSALLFSALLSHLCLPVGKPAPSLQWATGEWRWEEGGEGCAPGHGAPNVWQQHKFLPVMLLASPQNLRPESCQWLSSCEQDLWIFRITHTPPCHHALLVKVPLKVHS